MRATTTNPLQEARRGGSDRIRSLEEVVVDAGRLGRGLSPSRPSQQPLGTWKGSMSAACCGSLLSTTRVSSGLDRDRDVIEGSKARARFVQDREF